MRVDERDHRLNGRSSLFALANLVIVKKTLLANV